MELAGVGCTALDDIMLHERTRKLVPTFAGKLVMFSHFLSSYVALGLDKGRLIYEYMRVSFFIVVDSSL